MNLPSERAALVAALRHVPDYMQNKLEDIKKVGSALRERSDLLWYLLLQSAATQGNARGWKRLFEAPDIYAMVQYPILKELSPRKRESQILTALRGAGIRMQTIKAPRLAANFKQIEALGGVEAASRHMLQLPDQASKLAFICEFDGIGKKYGRNIWMDIYDSHFRHSIAVDERVKKITLAVGLESTKYEDIESFFVSVARDADREPWEVDRLLFNFNDHFLQTIEAAKRTE